MNMIERKNNEKGINVISIYSFTNITWIICSSISIWHICTKRVCSDGSCTMLNIFYFRHLFILSNSSMSKYALFAYQYKIRMRLQIIHTTLMKRYMRSALIALLIFFLSGKFMSSILKNGHCIKKMYFLFNSDLISFILPGFVVDYNWIKLIHYHYSFSWIFRIIIYQTSFVN
jgi:hypothetical protein